MFDQDLIFDFNSGEFIISQYAPVNIEISSPMDNGDYIVRIQTQNKKLISFLEDNNFSSAIKTTVSRNLGDLVNFFAHITIKKLEDLEEGLKQYDVVIKRMH